MKVLVSALALMLLAGTAAQAQTSALYGAPISNEQARRAASKAIEEARKNQWQIAVAIVDPGGELVYFERIDGTQTGSIGLAIEKAKTAVAYKRSTKALEDRVIEGRLQYLRQGQAIPIEGGLPLMTDGKVIGALGVSGVRSHQDGVVAQAGADALKAGQ
ncbi:MAG: heme-binding protein [Rhodospirillaceae bacterium]